MELIDPSENRFVLHPIRYPDVFKMGKDAIASFWTVEELDFEKLKVEDVVYKGRVLKGGV